MKYGEALKYQRESAGLSQSALSKATGLKQPMISYWEANKGLPSIDMCVQLAQFYGCTLDELVGLSDKDKSTYNNSLPTKIPDNAVAFAKDFGELISDNNFVNISKLYKAISPELRALTLGYIVGVLQSNGVNTKTILGY